MSLAPYHPQVVHFVIALLIVGVVFRLVSLTRRFTFTSPAATTLILLGTLASFVAVRSGEDAHGPVERVPGARQAVVEHEAWGEHARNAFVLLSLVELGALMLRWRNHRYAGAATIAAAVAGVASLPAPLRNRRARRRPGLRLRGRGRAALRRPGRREPAVYRWCLPPGDARTARRDGASRGPIWWIARRSDFPITSSCS